MSTHTNSALLENSPASSVTCIAPINERNGIPIHLKYPSNETDEGVARLAQLNRQAQAIGWQRALLTMYGDQPAFLDYMNNPARKKYIELLDLQQSDDVLEIGPGLGQFTRDLAPHVRSVQALEVVEGQAEFIHHSCQQLGINNVQARCGGDDGRLPYGDASFDLVVLSLVLEWCAGRTQDEDAETVQTRLLSEVHRVLKPGGRFYLCTKNRYALRFLTGHIDEHSHNVRFGSALPRWMLALYLKAKGLGKPPGHLHSHNRLQSLLTQVGFGQLQGYWAAPEMRAPTHYIRTEPQSVALARKDPLLRQGEYRTTAWLMQWVPNAWVKHVAPGLVFVARKIQLE